MTAHPLIKRALVVAAMGAALCATGQAEAAGMRARAALRPLTVAGAAPAHAPALSTATPYPTYTPYPTQTPRATATPYPTYTVAPSPTTQLVSAGSHGTPIACGITHMNNIGQCVVYGAVSGAGSGVRDAGESFNASDIWNHTSKTLTYDNHIVIGYYDNMLTVADYIFLVLGGLSFLDLLSRILRGLRFEDALDRACLLVAAIAGAHSARPLIGFGIDLANDITDLVNAQHSGDMTTAMLADPSGSASLATVFLACVAALMVVLLALQMFIRIGLLNVCIVVSPLAMMCYGWNRLHGWAELWSRLTVALIIQQFVQITALVLGEEFFAYGPDLIVPPGATIDRAVIGMFIGIGSLIAALLVPRILRSHTGNPAVLALLATRGLVGRHGGGGAAAAAAATGGAAAEGGA